MKYLIRKRKFLDWNFIAKVTIIYGGIFASPLIISKFSPQIRSAYHSQENSQKGLARRTASYSAQPTSLQEGISCSEK